MKIEISTEKDKQPLDEMITQLHASFRESILARESNFTPQITILVTGIGGYFISLINGYFTQIGLFYLITFSSLLLALFGFCLCILHGFQFRCDLFQLLKIEEMTKLNTYSLKKWPKYNKISDKIDPPNIIQAFQKAFIAYALIVSISSLIYFIVYLIKYPYYSSKWANICYMIWHSFYEMIVWIAFYVIGALLCCNRTIKHYKKKFRKIKEREMTKN